MIRLGLCFLFLGLGVAIHWSQGLKDAWYLYAASGLLLATHLLFGSVWTAFRQMKNGNIKEADRLLRQIISPNFLYPRHRAYYYFIKGMIALQRKQLDQGESHIHKAVQLGLRSDNDKALARLNLAHISFLKRKFKSASEQLELIKKMNPSDLIIQQNMAELEDVLSKLR